MGFEIEPGDEIIDDVAVSLYYLGKDSPMVLLKKQLLKGNRLKGTGRAVPLSHIFL
jgi:hypothetical protein